MKGAAKPTRTPIGLPARCCQTKSNTSQRVLSDKLEHPSKAHQVNHHAAQKLNHSARAVVHFCLKDSLLPQLVAAQIFFRKAKNCLLSNAELNLLPTFGKYRFHSTRRAKTPSKRAEIDLRLSFLPREAFIFGSSTKTEPFHDLRQRTVHEEGPPHYGAKAEIERTALLQVG
jgi:hypothetical protein